MPEVAHAVDCNCGPCNESRPEGYKKPVEHDWKADARETGKLHEAAVNGLWRAAFLVARNCEPSKGGRPAKDTETAKGARSRISFREYAKVAKLSDVTIGKYWNIWQSAAVNGWVPPSQQLSANKVPKAVERLTEDQWSQVSPKVAANKAASSSGSKASGAARPKVTPSDRTVPDDNSKGGKATDSRSPDSVVVSDGTTLDRVPGAVEGVVVPNAPLLDYVITATAAVQEVSDALKAGYPIEGKTVEALAILLERCSELRKRTMAMVKSQRTRDSIPEGAIK